MNVYLYGGRDRFNARTEVTPNNEPVTVNEVYAIDHEIGFVLIAYPN